MNRSFRSTVLQCLMLFTLGRPAQAGYTFATIDYPGAASTLTFGINNAGQIVGEYHDFGGTIHAFVLDGGNYEPFDYPGSTGTSALGINSSGDVVGIYGDFFGNTHAFRRVGTNYTELIPVDGSTYTQAGAINDAGHITGSYYTNNVDRGYLFNGTSYTTGLNAPGAQHTVALGINNADSIVGTYVTPAGARHGFLLVGSSYTTLDYPGAAFTVAQGINDSGQITGLYQDFGGTFHGFVRTGTTYTTVDPPGATKTQISGINSAGQLAGYFINSTGTHGFIATPMLEGDFNDDGSVDAADYVVWRKTDGTQAGYDAWRTNFGKTLPAGSGVGATGSASASSGPLSAAVPETSSLALAVCGVVGLLARFQRSDQKRHRATISSAAICFTLTSSGDRAIN